MNEYKTFDLGIIDNRNIKNGDVFIKSFDVVSDISHPIFSPDNKLVYFISSAWATSDALFSIDINTGQISYISDGNSLAVITKGSFAGDLLILKHKHYQGGGSYDHYFIVDSNGNEIKDVGNYDEFNSLKFLE